MRITSPPDRSQSRATAEHHAALALVGVLAGTVLVLTASGQIYDTNFQTLWEAKALLLGDHPYRDFFEWGLPLQAFVSAAAQILSGHRLIGEFLVQWIFIIAAMVVSTHLALQLSRPVPALVTMGLALLLLAATPTYHYPKLLFYPLALWLSWRYLDQPGVRRAALLGVTTAVAFLFRHDHGMYIGALAVTVFLLTRAAAPTSRTLRSMAAESGAYTAAATAILMPWLVVVHVNEGVPEYVRSRADLYEEWSASDSPYQSLWTMNPIRMLMADPPPAAKPAVVALTWAAGMDARRRAQLEQKFRLRPLHDTPDAAGRRRYEVPNIYDVNLWGLREEIDNPDSAEGFEWAQLERLQNPIPVATRTTAEIWIQQTVLLVPLLLLISAGIDAMQHRAHGTAIPLDCFRAATAAIFLIVIERSLLREASYALAVVPLTAAVSAHLLTGRRLRAEEMRGPARTMWVATRLALTATLLLVTNIAVFAYVRGTGLFNLEERGRTLAPLFATLFASPPIDAYQPSDVARLPDREMWNNGAVDKGKLLTRYLHDCSREGDRILVTGSTPYHIHYYVNRSVAGGHVFWHIGWRSDPARQSHLLALLQAQSVPFAFSTHDPVLDDLKRYPMIHEYFTKHYVELEGTGGVVLVDARRQPTSRFGRLGFPCFQ